MKALVIGGFCWVACVTSASGQVTRVKAITSRTVLTTKQSSLDHELRQFLVFTHESDDQTVSQTLFKVPLLVTTKYPDVGVYKFGLNSSHTGYNVVFQYRNYLVLSSARLLSPLITQLHQFLSQYPTAFSAAAQRTVQGQLKTIVEQNQPAGESDLPTRTH
jgi:hypothetical protein